MPRLLPASFDAAQRATLLRFILVSLVGTAIDFLVLWLLHTHYGLNVVLASLISTEASILNSFIWNQLWAFRGRSGRGSLLSRLITFNGLYGSMIVITLVVVGGLTALFGSRYYLLYKAITLPVNFVWTYLWSTLFLWRRGAVARESAPASLAE